MNTTTKPQQCAGVWVDHRKAVVVLLNDTSEMLFTVVSGLERHVRPSGGSRSKTPYGPQDVATEDRRERRYARHVDRYYDRVISYLNDAGSIRIYGPGEAKNEFRKRLDHKGFGRRVKGIETTGKLTDAHILVKVRADYRHSELSRSA